jgi:hypothetical protein
VLVYGVWKMRLPNCEGDVQVKVVVGKAVSDSWIASDLILSDLSL